MLSPVRSGRAGARIGQDGLGKLGSICDDGKVSEIPAASGPPPSHGGTRKAGAGDMIRSLLIILIPVLVITFIYTRNPPEAPVQPVEWRPQLAQARAAVDWPVLAPEGLPDTWVPTRVRWLPKGAPGLNAEPSLRNEWQLGFLDPERVYLELSQGDALPDDLIARASRQGVPDGTARVGNAEWQRLVSQDGRTRSLVRRADGAVTIVAGDVGYAQLEAYASTLSP